MLPRSVALPAGLWRYPPFQRAFVLIAADFIAIGLAFAVGALIMWQFSPYSIDMPLAELFGLRFTVRAAQVLIWALLLQAWFFNRGHYGIPLPPWSETQQVVSACLAVLVGDGFLLFALKQDGSRLWVVHTWVLAAGFIPLLRYLGRDLLRRSGGGDVRAILVGTPARMTAAEATLSERGGDYRIVASCSFSELADRPAWRALCRQYGAELVIVAAQERDLVQHRKLVAALALDHIPFISVQTLGGLPVFALDSHHLLGSDTLLLTHRPRLLTPVSRVIKTAFDFALGLLLILGTLPLMGVIALLVAADGGPVIYVDRRIGRDGTAFDCLKFRTMVADGSEALARHLAADPAARDEWQMYQKLRRDPRITRVGATLRAFSLDELPQLFNVLRGEMSLIGPRPLNSDEVARLIDDGAHYKAVKPGVTGLWQVSGRNALSFEQREQLDMWYVKNWSLWLDAVILLKTVPVLFHREGAY